MCLAFRYKFASITAIMIFLLAGFQAAFALPDMTITSMSITPDDPIFDSDLVRITVVFENIGDTAAWGRTCLKFWMNDTEILERCYFDQQSGSHIAQLVYENTLGQGSWFLVAEIDCYSDQAESDENNNVMIERIDILVGADTNPPPVPELISPALGSEYTSGNIPALQWGSVQDPEGNGTTYEYEIATDSEFVNIVQHEQDLDGNTYNLNSQLGADRYYWHVRASDYVGNASSWSNVWYFDIVEPDPVLESASLNTCAQSENSLINITYMVQNPGSVEVIVGLGCSIAPSGSSSWINSPDRDVEVTIGPGLTRLFARSFYIPQGVQPGAYSVWYGLRESGGSGPSGWGGYYDSLISDDLTIYNQTRYLYVAPDGTGQYETISDAVFAAADGDHIVLGEGVFDSPSATIEDKYITIRSEFENPGMCVVESGFHDYKFRLEKEFSLVGLWFRGGSGPTIRIVSCDSTQIEIRKCAFTNIQSSYSGVINQDGGVVKVLNCTIYNNHGHHPCGPLIVNRGICECKNSIIFSASSISMGQAENAGKFDIRNCITNTFPEWHIPYFEYQEPFYIECDTICVDDPQFNNPYIAPFTWVRVPECLPAHCAQSPEDADYHLRVNSVALPEYNDMGVLVGCFPAAEAHTENTISIISRDCCLDNVVPYPGGSFRAWYSVQNSGNSDMLVGLNCSIRDNTYGGGRVWIDDVGSDVVMVPSGGTVLVSRKYSIPDDGSIGSVGEYLVWYELRDVGFDEYFDGFQRQDLEMQGVDVGLPGVCNWNISCEVSGAINVLLLAEDNIGVATVHLLYGPSVNNLDNEIAMDYAGDETWTCTLPGQFASGDVIEFMAVATDMAPASNVTEAPYPGNPFVVDAFVSDVVLSINGESEEVFVHVDEDVVRAGTVSGLGDCTVTYHWEYREVGEEEWSSMGLDHNINLHDGAGQIPSAIVDALPGHWEYRVAVTAPDSVTSQAVTVHAHTTVHRLEVPYFHQGDTGWCVFSSIAMLLQAHGCGVTPKDVAAAFGVSWEEGLSTPDMQGQPFNDYFSSFGLFADVQLWSSLLYPLPLDQYLMESIYTDRPVLLNIIDALHAVVVVGIGEDGVYLNDPSGAVTVPVNGEGAGIIQEYVSWRDLHNLADFLPTQSYSTVRIDEVSSVASCPLTMEIRPSPRDEELELDDDNYWINPLSSLYFTISGNQFVVTWDGRYVGGYHIYPRFDCMDVREEDPEYGTVILPNSELVFGLRIANGGANAVLGDFRVMISEVGVPANQIIYPWVPVSVSSYGLNNINVWGIPFNSNVPLYVSPQLGDLGLMDGDPGSIQHFEIKASLDVGGDTSELAYVFAANEPNLTGVPDDVVRSFKLLQNHPNPFNPKTSICFELPDERAVELRVYDASGRLVRTLLGGETVPAGCHSFDWDGRDASGRTAPSGVYFYRLTAGEDADLGRMMLVK